MNSPQPLTSLQESLLDKIFYHHGMNLAAAQWWNKNVTFDDWWALYLHGFIQRGEYKNVMVVTQSGVDYLVTMGWLR